MFGKFKFLLIFAVIFYSSFAHALDEEYIPPMDEDYVIKFDDPKKQELYENAFRRYDNALLDIATKNVDDAGYFIGSIIDYYFIEPEQTFQNMILNQINHIKNEISAEDIPETCRQFDNTHQRIVCYQKLLEDYTEKYIFEGYPVLAQGVEFFPSTTFPEYKYYNLKPFVRKDFAIAFDRAHELFKNLSDEKEDIETLTELSYLKLLKFFDNIIEYHGKDSIEATRKRIQTKSPDYTPD